MNPWTEPAPAPRQSTWLRVRGICAALAVTAFLGAAVVAPFAMPSAEADELASPQELEQRLNQEFVAADAPEADFVFESSAVEQKPKPKPKPEPEPEPEEEEEAPEEDAGEAEAGAEGGDLPRYTGGGSPAKWMTAAGIPESDWAYVDFIAEKESGWNPNATNASSGACGVIQANPCSKVPGNGYDPVDNLKWANGYANDRYGGWKQAYDFWSSNHWW